MCYNQSCFHGAECGEEVAPAIGRVETARSGLSPLWKTVRNRKGKDKMRF